MMKVTFTTTVLQAEGMNATGLRVPAEVVAQLSNKKRPPVVVQLKGYTYRSTISPSGDVFMLSLSKENREAAGVGAGDEVEVTLELDTQPRTVEVPDDLGVALEAAGIRAVFDAAAPSARKEFVRQVESAKAQETRERRIAKIVVTLSEGK
jgi:hypothetical protein